MATYIAYDSARKTVTLMFSKAEADALRDLALYAEQVGDEGVPMNGQTCAAANRAIDALTASTNPSARRAGFFDT